MMPKPIYRVVFNIMAADSADCKAASYSTIEAAQAAICGYVLGATGQACALTPKRSIAVGAVVFYDVPGAACSIIRDK